MKDKIMIVYINVSTFLSLKDEDKIRKEISSLYESYIEKMNKEEILKCIVITYSNEKKSINEEFYNIMFDERSDDRIVFGKRFEKDNDIDYYEERYSKDQDISKMYIMSESFKNYNRIIPVNNIEIIDNNLNIEEQSLSNIFKGRDYTLNKIKNNKIVLKKSIRNN